MSKHYQSSDLQNQIDWDRIMKMDRYAGGHDDQMVGLFNGANLVAHWNEGDWQGMVATCVELDGEYIIYNDYYGSCSGCDSWEDASDDEVRAMCIGLANNALIFKSIEDVKEYLSNEENDDVHNWHGWSDAGKFLLGEINKEEGD